MLKHARVASVAPALCWFGRGRVQRSYQLCVRRSCYVAGDTRSFARDIGLEPRTPPLESAQSNGMAEAFVRTIKRDYVRLSPRPDAETVMGQLPAWIAHYNEVHPHKTLGYR